MKLLQIIMVMTALVLFVSPAFADSGTSSPQAGKMKHHENMPMNSSMMHHNMSSMGQLMQKMANTLKTENMTAEQLKECAIHMEHLSKVRWNVHMIRS